VIGSSSGSVTGKGNNTAFIYATSGLYSSTVGYAAYYSNTITSNTISWQSTLTSGGPNITLPTSVNIQLRALGVYEFNLSGTVLINSAITESSISATGFSNYANGTILWYNSGVTSGSTYVNVNWTGATTVTVANTTVSFNTTNLIGSGNTYYTFLTVKYISL